jgi:hypothetical protein
MLAIQCEYKIKKLIICSFAVTEADKRAIAANPL